MESKASRLQDEHITALWSRILVCALLTIVGFQLRSVILAVPPVLPLIQRDLGLSYTATGFLTSLPILVLACTAWPSGLLAERLGARFCVSLGLALLAAGSLLRAVWVSAFTLFAFTLLLSLGIALAQTAVPVLIRRWFPSSIGFVAALFSDGLIIGEAVAAGTTVPLMEQFWGRDAWAATFVFWSLPVVLFLVLWLWLAPPTRTSTSSHLFASRKPMPKVANQSEEASSPPRKVRVNAFHLGMLVGAGSLIYFGMNAWIASYNLARHQAFLTPLALTLLNAAQLPVSLLVTLFAQWLAGRRLPFIISGGMCATALIAWILTPASLEPLWAALLGGSSALVFTLGIALPPLLAEPHEVGSLTGITISLTYAVAFLGPLVGGTLWDIFHFPAVAFTPVLIASLALMLLGLLLPPRDAFGLVVPKRD